MRNRQVSRILRILHHLELNNQGLAAREILNKLNDEGHNCSRETVYRDLKAIEQAFIPLDIDETNEPAKYKLSRVAHVSKDVAFSYVELLALTISRESMRVFDGTTLEDVLSPMFQRLEKLLGLNGEKAMKEFSEYMGFKHRASYGVKVPREILDTLHQAWHNIGNCYLQKKEYQQAVDAYKKALKLDPKDEETRYNLAYALKNLPKEKKNGGGGQSQQPQNKKEESKNEKDKKNAQPQQSQMNKEQAEQLLKALMDNEKKLQDKRKQKAQDASKMVDKDW